MSDGTQDPNGVEKVLPAHPEDRAPLRVSALAICAVAGVLALLWILWLLTMTDVSALFRGGRPPLPPLYVQWIPALRSEAVLFAMLALALVIAAPTLVDPRRVRRGLFLLLLFAAAALLPLALFAARDDLALLGRQLERPEEFYSDAQRITDASSFLANYVADMPRLSLHGSHFPPGHALLLYACGELLGPGSLAAASMVLACFALAVVLVFVALMQLTAESAARQGALLVVAAPSLLDHACVAMDAVFFLLAVLAWSIGLRAFSFRGRSIDAILTGVSLLLATTFSFSALPLGLVIGLFALTSRHRPLGVTVRRLLLVGASYAAGAALLGAISGFDLWDCLQRARQAAHELLSSKTSLSPTRVHLLSIYGNATSYLVGAGVALVAGAAARLRRGPIFAHAWTPAALAALFVMIVSGIYCFETERIWMFAMPWLAGIALAPGALSSGSLQRLLAAGLVQSLVMEVLLFTWW